MRAYLLGTLEPATAAAFEDQYFADDAVFAELKQAEDLLIADFLEGRLPPQDRRLFEARYLRVPELKQKLHEARAERRSTDHWGFRLRWVAAAAVLLLATAGAFWYSRSARESTPTLTARSVVPAEVIPLDQELVPFLAKGAGGTANQFPAPPPQTPLRLKLELPGRSDSVEATVKLIELEAGGARKPVWQNAASARSTPTGSGQEVRVVLPAGLLARGDYLLEAMAPDGSSIQSYYFRVTDAR